MQLPVETNAALTVPNQDENVTETSLDTGNTTRAHSSQITDKMPMAFVAVFLSLCIPVFFGLGSLHLSISRILLLALFPYLFFKVYTGRCGGIRWVDIGMLLFVLCLALSIFMNNRSVFLTFVGSNAIIILGGYMAGRVFIRGPNGFVGFIKLFAGILLFTLPFALYEGQTSYMVIPRLLDKLPMITSSIDVNYPPRRGFYRVQVLFTHPIHYGLFASMCFSLIFIGLRTQLSKATRIGLSLCVVICCFSAVSSGPILSLMAQIALIMYAWIANKLGNKWYKLLGGFAIFYILLEIVSSRPAFFAIAERLSFSSETAYARRILLDYGVAQVARTPWLGVGYNEWDLPDYMTGSMDNYWLLTALVYGIPAFGFLISALIVSLIKAGGRDFSADPFIENLRSAWAFVICSLILTLSTVAIWSEIATLVFLFLGSGAWLLDYKIPDKGDKAQADTSEPTGNIYTRFPSVTPRTTPQKQLVYSRLTDVAFIQKRIKT